MRRGQASIPRRQCDVRLAAGECLAHAAQTPQRRRLHQSSRGARSTAARPGDYGPSASRSRPALKQASSLSRCLRAHGLNAYRPTRVTRATPIRRIACHAIDHAPPISRRLMRRPIAAAAKRPPALQRRKSAPRESGRSWAVRGRVSLPISLNDASCCAGAHRPI